MYYFLEELIQKSENTTENEIILSNMSETEIISSTELKSGDIVFCCNFEDFDHIYLCKGSKNNTKLEIRNVFTDSSKLKGKYHLIIEIIY